jgi:hypothetical protein
MVPAVAHLVWLGGALSPVGWLSARAALERSQLDAVVLHGDARSLAQDPLVRDLLDRPGFSLRDLDPGAASAPDAAVRARLDQLDRLLRKPAAQADLWRLRILWQHGGVYLDADAVTLRDLRPLLGDAGFAGLERVCLPAAVTNSKDPRRWAKAGLLLGLREVASRLPDPGRAFGPIERFYDLACNNAVVGAEPQHRVLGQLLAAAATMDLRKALTLYELGPRLLEGVTGNRPAADFALHPPQAFYPLAPEVCAAYVRDDPKASFGDVPHPQAFVAHLYDSVLARRVGRLDAAWLTGPGRRTLLGRMVQPWLDDLQRLAV